MEQKFLIDINDKLEKILVQTTKTNGRVDSLEKVVYGGHEKSINKLTQESSEKKGENRMMWIFLSAAGAVALVIIGYYLNK